MVHLDVSALRTAPTEQQLSRFGRGIDAERWPTVHAAASRARVLAVALLVGDVAAGAMVALVLRESLGPVRAVLLGLVVLAGLLTASRLMASRLRRSQLDGWVRLDVFARENDLRLVDRPSRVAVPGRMLNEPTTQVRYALRRQLRPGLELGLVRHDPPGSGDGTLTRYVARQSDQTLPWLLVSGPDLATAGPQQASHQLVPQDVEGLRPPIEDALPQWTHHHLSEAEQHEQVSDALLRFDENFLVHGDTVVEQHRDELMPPRWRERLAQLQLGSLEVVDGWLVATLPPPDRLADPEEWGRVEQVLELLDELEARLVEVARR